MLRLERVSVRFGGVAALTDVTAEIAGEATTGLVGPNGAGKTTLFNTISGLVAPTAGRVLFGGADLAGKALHQRARLGIGRSFQIPQPLHELTVRENLVVAQAFGAGRDDPARIDHILGVLDLAAKAGANAATELALSEHKRLEVGKALATEPRLLLLDEVLAGLETAGKRAFIAMLGRLRRDWNLGMIVIEHDIETIMTLGDRAIVLDFGRIIADGAPDAVFRDPAVRRSYTGAEAADA